MRTILAVAWVSVFLASPGSAGLLRSASIDVTVQGYGTASAIRIPHPSNPTSFVGTVSGGAASGRFLYYELLTGETWLLNSTAPVSAIRIGFDWVALTGDLPDGHVTGGVEGFVQWRAGGATLQGGGPTLLAAIPYQRVFPGTHGSTFTFFQDTGLRLGPVSVMGLTLGGAPHPTAPTLRTTGGTSVTPSGDVRVQIVTLGRIRARGIETSTRGWLARIDVVYAPETQALALLGMAAIVLTAARRRSRLR